MTDLENWEIAIPLNSAFDQFGDPYQRAKFREAQDVGANLAHKMLMFADLFCRIYQKEFAAFGFRIQPIPSDGPIRIPYHVFDARPNVDQAEQDIVAASGYVYERVRICPQPSEVPELVEDHPSHQSNGGGPGRKSLYDKVKTVLAELFETPSNRSKSPEKLHPHFELEFRKQYPPDEWDIAPPSVRTLREHLKRFRQESAEIGKNNISN